VFLTSDQTLAHEQNLSGHRLAVIALSAIQLPVIRENLRKTIAAIDNAAPGSFRTSAARSAGKSRRFNRSRPCRVARNR
jgi:hypothetical protein